MTRSKRTFNKIKILGILKNNELGIDDMEMYCKLHRLDIVPILVDLVRWHDVVLIRDEIDYNTHRLKKIYTITEKGKKKLRYLASADRFTVAL